MNRTLCCRIWILFMVSFYSFLLAYFSIWVLTLDIFFHCASHILPVAQTSLLFHLIFFFFSFNPQADPTKAVITLKPPWVSVFREENVTLLCEGPHLPGDTSTQWFLNGTAIKTLTPRYSINGATFKDSGEYKCQTGLSMPSDPVQLEIYSGKYGMEQEG